MFPSLSVCVCWGGDWNEAAGEAVKDRAGKALGVLMSVAFIPMSVRGLWEGLKQGWGDEMFVHHGVGKVWGALGGDMRCDRGRFPEHCKNESPGSEEKPREGPPSLVGVPGKSHWQLPDLVRTVEGSCPLLLWPSSIRGPSSVSVGTLNPSHTSLVLSSIRVCKQRGSSITKSLRAMIIYPQKTHILHMVSSGYSS